MWKITNKKQDAIEILLYDVIGSGEIEGVNAKDLITQIKNLGQVAKINLRINSVGGDIFEAQAIYSYLKNHEAKIEVSIDGIAASAASVIAMVGDKITMPENALMMIHNPSGNCYGEAENMLKTAEILNKVKDSIIAIYSERTGLDKEKISELMDAETWLNAHEAHELGFCDNVDSAIGIAAVACENGILVRNILGCARLNSSQGKNLLNKAQNNLSLNFTGGNNVKEKEIEIKNVKDLEANYADLVAQARNEAILAERARIKMLDELNCPGCEDLIFSAKYDEIKDARDIALEILTSKKAQAKLNAMYQDSQVVNSALSPEISTQDSFMEEQNAINAVVNEIKKLRR